MQEYRVYLHVISLRFLYLWFYTIFSGPEKSNLKFESTVVNMLIIAGSSIHGSERYLDMVVVS